MAFKRPAGPPLFLAPQNTNLAEERATEQEIEFETLEQETRHIEQEARMLLPGIQALLGFQLIAVFQSSFRQILTSCEQVLHFLAIALLVVTIAMVLTPAAYHRQREPQMTSKKFVKLSTRLLSTSMVPLLLAMSIEVYVIARLILGDGYRSAVPTLILSGITGTLWFALPRFSRRVKP